MERNPTQASGPVSRSLIFIFFSILVLVGGGGAARALLAQQADPPDSLTYTKVLKGSVPEYEAITVDVNGVGSYDGRKLSQSSHPRPLKLSESTTQTLFALAHSLGDFRSIRLESRKKVANLGLKTFIYQHDGRENKVEFNFTQNRKAQDLTKLFEGIAAVEQNIDRMEFSARYDPLGLPADLTQIEIDLNNKALVDPQLMVPILKKIAGDSQYLHIAQMRAVDILRRIENPK